MTTNKKIVRICHGKNCKPYAGYIQREVEKFANTDDTIVVEECLCLRNCTKAPNVEFNGELFEQVTPKEAIQLIKKQG